MARLFKKIPQKDVSAENLNISKSILRSAQGHDVFIEKSIGGAITAGHGVSMDNSAGSVVVAGNNIAASQSNASVMVSGGDIQASNSNVGVITTGGNANLQASNSVLIITPQAEVKESRIRLLLAANAQINDSKILMNHQQAAIIGVVSALLLIIGQLCIRFLVSSRKTKI